MAAFAGVAGFAGDSLVSATALALAASGGDDAWRFAGGLGAGFDQRGLWALDVRRVPFVAGLDLFDPRTNAAATKAAYDAAGGDFGWHPVFGAPGYLRALETAARAVSEPYRPDTIPDVATAAPALAAGRHAPGTIARVGRTLSEVGRALRSQAR